MKPLSVLALVLLGPSLLQAEEKPIKILFLGDNGHHKPADRFRQLQPVLAKRGIDLSYTDKVEALSAKMLAGYDGLMIYANHTKWAPENEAALIEYVESGHGFIPLHCASYCFIDSKKYVDLVGAQFLRHNTGTFRTTIAEPFHPIMKGFKGFESWDETYVHTKHNEKDRTVLEYRTEGDKKEPWTWVRTQGKGRVFYTAWGHDERTFGNPGFQNLVERGVRWAVGKDPGVAAPFADKPVMTPKRQDVKPFEYVEAKVPFYPPSPKWGVTANPLSKMQKPLDVAESIKHFVAPVDFEVRPFVTEEKLGGKPIAMTWGERGRLWVAITQDYPNERRPEGQGRDRIVICEDTDGDGVCDKVTTFADKLSIPTSLLIYNGGVIVHQAPETLFLKDTKGDGKADLRQVLFTGWGTSDTHAGPSNLRYGFDNWIYGMVGYAGFRGAVAGERHDFRQGLYRFKVERESNGTLKATKLEFLRNTNNNSWGVGFSEEGLLFGSTANGCPSVFMPIPNRYYERMRGLSGGVLPSIAVDNHFEPITDKVRQVDWHGGFTAGAGHEIYTARAYPKEYWNRVAFVSEPTGHLTAAMTLQPDGSSFKTRYGWNLLASDDEWSAPIDAQVGPDGNVWVIDWYNFIVQHNPTPPGFRTGKGAAYETELRDKKHGRIYRVVYTKAKDAKPFKLKDATLEQLVAALKSPVMTWRLHAQRLLVERGKTDVSEALLKLVEDKTVDETGLNAGAVHALWTLQGLYGNETSERLQERKGLARAILTDNPSSAVRRAAALVLWNSHDPDTIAQFDKMATDDPEPQVRLAALLAMADRGLAKSAENNQDKGGELSADHDYKAIGEMLVRDGLATDANLRDALTMAVAAHPLSIYWAIHLNKPLPAPALRILEIATTTAARDKRIDFFVEGDKLLELSKANPAAAAAFINGLAAGWPKDHVPQLSDKTKEAIAALAVQLPDSARGKMVKLAVAWGVNGVAERFVPVINALLVSIADESKTDAQRIAAAKQVIEFRPDDDDTVGKVLKAISARSSPELAAGLFEALGGSQAKSLGKAVIARLPDLSPAGRTSALRLVLSRTIAIAALLDAFEKGELSASELTLEQRQALLAHPNVATARRARAILAKGGGLPNADREKVVQEFLEVTKKKGDPEAGKVVFKNQCSKCHMHGTEGNRIGPDLTGVAVHTKEHLLIDILDPSRNVEGNFRIYRLTTTDGKTFNGLLAAESKTSVELIDAEAKKYVFAREDIDELRASTKSLMPEGFEKQFKGDDLINLLEFLTQKGKYLPIPLDKAATIVTTKGMFFDESSTIERMIFADWSPKTFENVPFQLIDPRGDKIRNAILLYGPNGTIAPTMPRSATVPCNTPAKAIHLLSGVSGWGFPGGSRGSVSLIVRLHYDDGKTEDHELKNGEHFADYIRRVDVPGSKFAFALRGQQLRYLAITPKRETAVNEIEFVKGGDGSAPIIMAVTVETR